MDERTAAQSCSKLGPLVVGWGCSGVARNNAISWGGPYQRYCSQGSWWIRATTCLAAVFASLLSARAEMLLRYCLLFPVFDTVLRSPCATAPPFAASSRPTFTTNRSIPIMRALLAGNVEPLCDPGTRWSLNRGDYWWYGSGSRALFDLELLGQGSFGATLQLVGRLYPATLSARRPLANPPMHAASPLHLH